MANSLTLLDQIFASQKEAESFFYQIRDTSWENKTAITEGRQFELLRALYEEYCRCTDWPLPGKAVSFLARYIGREGGTTVGFGVIFDNGKETEFSARKAIKAVAAGVAQ
ncbi:hypothetical protein [Aeromonas salmonicida]|uniref:hypothetical protein n=1 Tax=Aeromonas salmonicida TaxID=645 RepID=UPI000B3FD9BB|nr:hypothetical protein [Aeromonas salmonicida]ARW85391.1 hypothetical protein O23A_P4p0023 [Aeromonas salmonicida]